jgi:hypothetical protein
MSIHAIISAAQKDWRVAWVIGLTFLLALGQGQRITIIPGLPFYLHDIWAAWYLCMAIPDLLRKRKKHSRLLLLILFWISYTGLFGAILTHSFYPLAISLRFVVYGIVGLDIWRMVRASLSTSARLVQVLQYSMITIWLSWILIGVAQYVFAPDQRHLEQFGWDAHYFRLIGATLDPNFTGLHIALGLCFTSVYFHKQISTFLFKHRWKPSYLYGLGVTLLAVAAIVATYSRASWLALVLAGGWIGVYYVYSQLRTRASTEVTFRMLWQKNRRLFFTSALLLVFAPVVFFLLPKPGGEGVNIQRTATIVSRSTATQSTLSHIQLDATLVFGRGLGWQRSGTTSTELSQDLYNHGAMADNLIVGIITSTGLVGLLLSLILIRNGWIVAHRVYPGMVAALIVLLLHAQFNNSVFEPLTWWFFWLGWISVQTSQFARDSSRFQQDRLPES